MKFWYVAILKDKGAKSLLSLKAILYLPILKAYALRLKNAYYLNSFSYMVNAMEKKDVEKVRREILAVACSVVHTIARGLGETTFDMSYSSFPTTSTFWRRVMLFEHFSKSRHASLFSRRALLYRRCALVARQLTNQSTIISHQWWR